MLTRPAPPPDHTLSYGPHPDNLVDIYGRSGPLVLFIHGGFWRAEYDRAHIRPLCADLAAGGYRAAAIEFRRTGPTTTGWPHTFADVALAVRTVPDLVAAAAGGPSDPPVVAGHSAGGHLALWVAAEPDPAVRGVLALAPVTDLIAAYRQDLDGGAAAALLGGAPADQPERYAAADPMTRPAPTAPTTLIHGDQDRQVPIDFSIRYAARTGAHLVALPGVEHFALIDPLSTAWPTVTHELAALATPR